MFSSSSSSSRSSESSDSSRSPGSSGSSRYSGSSGSDSPDSSGSSGSSESYSSSGSSGSSASSSSSSSSSVSESPVTTPSTPGGLLTLASDTSPFDSTTSIARSLATPPAYTVEVDEDGRIVRHGDPELEWPARPEIGAYSAEAEREARRNERWAMLEAEDDYRDQELMALYESEWLVGLTIVPPPTTPHDVQMKPFTEICVTLGVDEVALIYEGRDFDGAPLSCAFTYLIYHTKDDRICVEAKGWKWREPGSSRRFDNLRDLAIAFDEEQ